MGEMVEILTILGITSIGGAATLLIIRFIFRKFSEESSTANIIQQLREEVDRHKGCLSKISELTSELTRLHEEILELRKTNLGLRFELEQLRINNEVLAAKIRALDSGLEKVTGEWRAMGEMDGQTE